MTADVSRLVRGMFQPTSPKAGALRVPERLRATAPAPVPALIVHDTSGVRRRVRRTKP